MGKSAANVRENLKFSLDLQYRKKKFCKNKEAFQNLQRFGLVWFGFDFGFGFGFGFCKMVS